MTTITPRTPQIGAVGSTRVGKSGSARFTPRFSGTALGARYNWTTPNRDKEILAKSRPDAELARHYGCDRSEISHRRGYLRDEAERTRLRRLEFAKRKLLAR